MLSIILFFTTQDLGPILVDHIITINSVNTLRYISVQTVCSQTLRRSPTPES